MLIKSIVFSFALLLSLASPAFAETKHYEEIMTPATNLGDRYWLGGSMLDFSRMNIRNPEGFKKFLAAAANKYVLVDGEFVKDGFANPLSDNFFNLVYVSKIEIKPTPVRPEGMKHFVCFHTDSNSYDPNYMQNILVSSDKLAVLDAVNGEIDEEKGGTIDTTYTPSAANANYARLVGFSSLFDEGSTWMLVEKNVLAGQAGRVKVQGRGEGFFNESFNCKPSR